MSDGVTPLPWAKVMTDYVEEITSFSHSLFNTRPSRFLNPSNELRIMATALDPKDYVSFEWSITTAFGIVVGDVAAVMTAGTTTKRW